MLFWLFGPGSTRVEPGRSTRSASDPGHMSIQYHKKISGYLLVCSRLRYFAHLNWMLVSWMYCIVHVNIINSCTKEKKRLNSCDFDAYPTRPTRQSEQCKSMSRWFNSTTFESTVSYCAQLITVRKQHSAKTGGEMNDLMSALLLHISWLLDIRFL